MREKRKRKGARTHARAQSNRQSAFRLTNCTHDSESVSLFLNRKMEIHEIEERKNKHINDLMDNFEKAFTDMRNYYNSITQGRR